MSTDDTKMHVVDEDKDDEKKVSPSRSHRLPACIVTYQALLQGTCAANCGQPLVCGAGPSFTKTRIVLDGETARWYHIRCYDTCSEDQWAKHTAQFTNAPDSKFYDEEHALQCRDVVRHWVFLKDLTAQEDLAVQCTPWTTPIPPSHLDRILLHIGADYAARAVWPDISVLNRPGPFQASFEQMFPVGHFTQFALVWSTLLSGESEAQIQTGLKLLAQQVTDAVAAIKPWGAQICVQPRFYRIAGDRAAQGPRRHPVVLRLACQAVHGSSLYYEPLTILSQGSMTTQMPLVAKSIQAVASQVQTVIQAVLVASARTVTEIHLADGGAWQFASLQYRCLPYVLPDKRIKVLVGLSQQQQQQAVDAPQFVAVGPKANSLVQLRVKSKMTDASAVYVPYEIPHAQYARFTSIPHAESVQVTPLSAIAL